jgi:hypothetical protein
MPVFGAAIHAIMASRFSWFRNDRIVSPRPVSIWAASRVGRSGTTGRRPGRSSGREVMREKHGSLRIGNGGLA